MKSLSDRSAPGMGSIFARVFNAIGYGAAYLGACMRVAKQRRDLLALDRAMLEDIGLTRAEVEAEASRTFFDIPETAKPGRSTPKPARRPSRRDGHGFGRPAGHVPSVG